MVLIVVGDLSEMEPRRRALVTGGAPLQGQGDTTAIVASLQSVVFSSFSLLHTLAVTGLLSGLPLTLRSVSLVNLCK